MSSKLPVRILRPRCAVLMSVLLCGLFAACGHNFLDFHRLHARAGRLDLSVWNFNRGDTVGLDGEWEFYWNRHVPPAEAKSGKIRPDGFIRVPGTWKGQVVGGKPLPGTGMATYRLRITLPERVPLLAFKVQDFNTAYTIHVNGKTVCRAGKTGPDREGSVPQWKPKVCAFVPPGVELDLVLHFSNFHYDQGGPCATILLGREDRVRNLREQDVAFDLFLVGGLFIMTLYHLGLYLLRRKNPSPLYFSIICFLMGVTVLVTGEYYINRLLPGIPWELMAKIGYLSSYLAVPVFMVFMKSVFPDEIHRRVVWVYIGTGAVFSIFVAVTPARIYYHSLTMYHCIALSAALYLVVALIWAVKKRREGSRVFLAGFAVLSAAVLNDILYEHQLVMTGYWVSFGMFIFIFAQALLLSVRFSRTFTRVEELLDEKNSLERANRMLENLSFEDGLTGIANRRRFEEYYLVEWKRASRSAGPISLIMADVDLFKDYNDNYGHQAGDEVLKRIADALKRSLRRSADFVARFGGEEFVVVLPGTGTEGAFSIAESMRLAVMAEKIPHAFSWVDGSITISLGIATFQPTPDADPALIIEQADRALYHAKQEGRNRTVVFKG